MTTGVRHILVINSGSSSLKFSLLDVQSESVIASGIAERLGTKEASLNFSANGAKKVHGGEYFRDAVIVDDEVIKRIEELSDLAPLHNPPGAQGIRVASELFPQKPQVAVFDTAFHQTLPPHAFHYAIPPEFYSKHRIRRYGFHGTSNQYITQELARRLGRPLTELQVLTAHLGNGCSATAVKQGKSVDTTMGLTPLEGVVMGTRSGDVDPSLHLFLQEREGFSLGEVTDILAAEKRSSWGLRGEPGHAIDSPGNRLRERSGLSRG